MSFQSGGSDLSHRKDTVLRIVVLSKDNSNQDVWLASLRNYARAKGCLTFMLLKYNAHRVVQGSDFTREGLLNPNVKIEPIEVEDVDVDHELSEEEKQAGVAAKHLANAQAGALKATAAYVDLTEMDDYEHQIFDGMVIFIDPSTGLDESPALSMKRFAFSTALTSSLPYHKHKLRTWTEGDCYQLIKLVCVQVRLTGRAQ